MVRLPRWSHGTRPRASTRGRSLLATDTRARSSLGLTAALAALVVAAAPAPAHAAQRVEVFDLPSAKGNVDLAQNKLNETNALRANVVLPDGYDEQPGRAWPVVYMLHGARDNTGTWLDPKAGNLLRRATGLGAILVMPEGGRSYYTDHWLGGRRTGSNWERYFLEEVVPTVESRYRILPGRANHAVLGSSMGGLGAMLYAAQLPSYFGSVVSMSGLLDLEEPTAMFVLPVGNEISYPRIWGAYGGQYARGHSPLRLLGNLVHTRARLSTGNGVVDQSIPSNAQQAIIGGAIEVTNWGLTKRAYSLARSAGVPVTLRTGGGVHDWPYWSREFPRAVDWGLFTPVAGDEAAFRRSFTYRTIAPRGNAWGLGYRFAAPPTAILDLTREGQRVRGSGRGTLAITPGAADADASGAGTKPECAFTATLPFERTLPEGC